MKDFKFERFNVVLNVVPGLDGKEDAEIVVEHTDKDIVLHSANFNIAEAKDVAYAILKLCYKVERNPKPAKEE